MAKKNGALSGMQYLRPRRPVRRGYGRTLVLSLLLSVLLHCAGAAAVIFFTPREIHVNLLLQSGVEAITLEAGGGGETAPSRPSSPVAAPKVAVPNPVVTEEAEEKPPLVTENGGETALLQGSVLLHDRTSLGEDVDNEAATVRESDTLRQAMRRREAEKRRELFETEPDRNPPDVVVSSRQLSIASADSAAGAAVSSRPRGVRTRPEPEGTFFPRYPEVSRQRGEEGEVVVCARIGTTGGCDDAWVEHSSGFPDLDRAALDTVQGARYRPGSVDGFPVSMVDTFLIEFQLR